MLKIFLAKWGFLAKVVREVSIAHLSAEKDVAACNSPTMSQLIAIQNIPMNLMHLPFCSGRPIKVTKFISSGINASSFDRSAERPARRTCDGDAAL
jgi:hypothetical protein